MALVDHKKERIEDKEFSENIQKSDYKQKDFVRVFAVNKVFENVDFSQCSFSSCYFRKCKFIRCNFQGAFFKETYLRGSSFPECIFKYTTFEKTAIDESFLDTSLPAEENLARDLVRALRVNFSQIGNYDAVNKASAIEVKLTGVHLYKAAYSKESYYRGKEKYSGFNRFLLALDHAKWKLLDLLWGNGESIFRILISSLVFVLCIAAMHWLSFQVNFLGSLKSSVYGFWGVGSHLAIPNHYRLTLTIGRLIFFSLFISVLVKRLAKR